MSLNRVVFSSMSDHWSTPEKLFGKLQDEFLFDFDPCPILSSESGLFIDWKGRVFCNPPYSKIPQFIKKGLWSLANKECKFIVFLLPSRTDTEWFHEYCLRASEIRFLRGRLKFGDAKNNAPFPSMIVIFREWTIDYSDLAA